MDENFKKELFENWMASTKEYIFFKDMDGLYVEVSESTAELAGFETPEEMIGKYDNEIYPPKIAQSFMIQDRKVEETGKMVIDSDWIDHTTFGKMLIETVKSPMYDKTGKMIGIQGISRDITDRFFMNEKLQNKNVLLTLILDCIPIPIWLKDKNNCYLAVNDAYKKFYKITDESFTGHNIATVLQANKLFDAEGLKKLKEQDDYVIATKKASAVELDALIDGQTKRVKVLKTPVLADDGFGIGFVGFCQNVMEFK